MSLDLALRLGARGYAVFPLGEDKAPVLAGGHKRATREPDEILDLWAEAGGRAKGVGICPGACDPPLIVLDVDRKGAVDGLTALAAIDPDLSMALAIGDIEPTQRTPSGGIHLFFRSDGAEHRNSAGKLGPGLDTRGTHGYVKVYADDLPDPRDLPEAPAYILELGRKSTDKPRAENPPSVSLPSAIRAAKFYLRHEAPEATEGARNETAYRVAAQLKNIGLSDADALAMILEYWAPTKCHPPLDEEELAAVVANAYRYSQEGPREDRITATGKLLDKASKIEKSKTENKPRWRVYYGDEFAQRPPPRWLVKGLLQADSLVLLTGTYRSFKSFIALDIALSLASGRPVLGNPDWKPVEPQRVLYLCGEGSADLGVRYRAYTKARLTGSIDRCGFIDDVPQISDFTDPEFVALADAHDVIVIDTLARVTVGIDENSNADMGTVVATLDGLRKGRPADKPLTVIVVHHTGKNGQEPRGASALAAAADTILLSTRIDKHTAALTIHKQKAAATPDYPFELTASVVDLGEDLSSLVFSVTGEVLPPTPKPKGKKFDPSEQAIADVLKECHTKHPTEPVKILVERAAQLLSDDDLPSEELRSQVMGVARKLVRRGAPLRL